MDRDEIETLRETIRERKFSFFDRVTLVLLLWAQRICERSGHGIIVHLPSGRVECTLCHKKV